MSAIYISNSAGNFQARTRGARQELVTFDFPTTTALACLLLHLSWLLLHLRKPVRRRGRRRARLLLGARRHGDDDYDVFGLFLLILIYVYVCVADQEEKWCTGGGVGQGGNGDPSSSVPASK
jgi:hypothetical protein